MLAATAAPALLLWLLGSVQRRQDGKCLGHGRLSWRCRRFLEVGAEVVVEVLAEEVGVADEGAGGAAVLERAARGPGWIGTR